MVRSIDPGELPEYAVKVVKDAVRVSNLAFFVTADENLQSDSAVHLASGDRNFNELLYLPTYERHKVHLVVNAAFKIRRFWQVPAQERTIPEPVEPDRLPERYEQELRSKHERASDAGIEEVSRFLYYDLLRQVTSLPRDIRVEHDIAEQLPEHRDRQRAVLAEYIGELAMQIGSPIGSSRPLALYMKSAAMDLALLHEWCEILGESVPAPLKNHEASAVADELQSVLNTRNLSADHLGDRLLSDAWAERLEIRDWYSWKPLQ